MSMSERGPRKPESARLEFREWGAEDLEQAVELWGDPRVTAFIDASGPLDRACIEERLRQQLELWALYGMQYWPIYLRDTGEFVGCAGIRPYDLEHGVYELGFHLCARYWGRGLASESALAAALFAFERIGVRELFAGHHPDNVASRRVLEKLGFRYTHDEHYAPTGLMHPSYRLKPHELQRDEQRRIP